MQLQFYDDPSNIQKDKEDVRLNRIAIEPIPNRRMAQLEIDITPFRERPCLEITVTNQDGELAAALNVIETISPNFQIVVHLRDANPTKQYEVRVELYYVTPGEPRQIIDEGFAALTIV